MYEFVVTYIAISLFITLVNLFADLDELESPAACIGKACALLLFWPIFLLKMIYLGAAELWKDVRGDD